MILHNLLNEPCNKSNILSQYFTEDVKKAKYIWVAILNIQNGKGSPDSLYR